jgi:NTE family protein
MAFVSSPSDRLAIGLMAELALSDELIRNTYRGSLAQAMAYQPMLGSKVLFLESFRAYNFVAAGTVLDFRLWKNGFIRSEIHGFQPIESIVSDEKGPRLGQNPPTRWMAGTRIYFDLGVGPVSLGLEYYHQERNPWFFELHWGYRIFQPTARR